MGSLESGFKGAVAGAASGYITGVSGGAYRLDVGFTEEGGFGGSFGFGLASDGLGVSAGLTFNQNDGLTGGYLNAGFEEDGFTAGISLSGNLLTGESSTTIGAGFDDGKGGPGWNLTVDPENGLGFRINDGNKWDEYGIDGTIGWSQNDGLDYKVGYDPWKLGDRESDLFHPPVLSLSGDENGFDAGFDFGSINVGAGDAGLYFTTDPINKGPLHDVAYDSRTGLSGSVGNDMVECDIATSECGSGAWDGIRENWNDFVDQFRSFDPFNPTDIDTDPLEKIAGGVTEGMPEWPWPVDESGEGGVLPPAPDGGGGAPAPEEGGGKERELPGESPQRKIELLSGKDLEERWNNLVSDAATTKDITLDFIDGSRIIRKAGVKKGEPGFITMKVLHWETGEWEEINLADSADLKRLVEKTGGWEQFESDSITAQTFLENSIGKYYEEYRDVGGAREKAQNKRGGETFSFDDSVQMTAIDFLNEDGSLKEDMAYAADGKPYIFIDYNRPYEQVKSINLVEYLRRFPDSKRGLLNKQLACVYSSKLNMLKSNGLVRPDMNVREAEFYFEQNRDMNEWVSDPELLGKALNSDWAKLSGAAAFRYDFERFDAQTDPAGTIGLAAKLKEFTAKGKTVAIKRRPDNRYDHWHTLSEYREGDSMNVGYFMGDDPLGSSNNELVYENDPYLQKIRVLVRK